MISLLSLQYEKTIDIQRGYPVPNGPCESGWHCSICGKPVASGHMVCCLHEVNPATVSGVFCVAQNSEIPKRAKTLQFKLDNLRILFDFISTSAIEVPNDMGQAIVATHFPDWREQGAWYRFEASDITLVEE